jgi:outer membrane protein TolC
VSLLDVVTAQRDFLLAQRTLHQIERDALVARWRLAVAVDAW